MRKIKKINGFLVVRFNDREKRNYRANRGYNSARNWNYNNATNQNANVGFRPAL